jgi:hypothetical protein
MSQKRRKERRSIKRAARRGAVDILAKNLTASMCRLYQLRSESQAANPRVAFEYADAIGAQFMDVLFRYAELSRWKP